MKPTCVLGYNRNMGTVDRSDMLNSSIGSVRKSIKWFKKLFFHFLDMCVINSHAIYNHLSEKKKTIPIADFQLELARQMIEKHCKPETSRPRRIVGEHPVRLTARHFVKEGTQIRKFNSSACPPICGLF